MTQLSVLRALALKGHAPGAQLAASLALAPDALQESLAGPLAEGLVEETPHGLSVTPAGRKRLEQLLLEERSRVDAAAFDALYLAFCELNEPFKRAVTDFQLAQGEVDAGERALKRLRGVHGRLLPLLGDAIELAPRLGPFEMRLRDAFAQIQEGDARYVASPLVDSYHTIWFELHEELIHLAGRTRAEEARAGRG
jgi:pyruvate,orthophosphate dikinase